MWQPIDLHETLQYIYSCWIKSCHSIVVKQLLVIAIIQIEQWKCVVTEMTKMHFEEWLALLWSCLKNVDHLPGKLYYTQESSCQRNRLLLWGWKLLQSAYKGNFFFIFCSGLLFILFSMAAFLLVKQYVPLGRIKFVA